MRGERRRCARTHVQCFLGVLESDRRLQARFAALAGRERPGAAPPPAARRGKGRGRARAPGSGSHVRRGGRRR
jgi:hypothetical protein